MNVVSRVRGAGLWIAGLWLMMFGLSRIASAIVGAAASTAMGPYAGPTPGREDLFAVAQLGYLHQALSATSLAAPAFAALVGIAGWTLVAPMVIARLDGPRTAAELGETWLTTLAPMLVQTVWHAILRALALVVVAVSLGPISPIAMLVGLLLIWWISTLGLDFARVGVVLHGARPFHPATAFQGMLRAAKTPRLLAITAGLSLLQAGSAAAIGHRALASIGPGSSTLSTALLLLVGIALGMFRLAFVVDHGPVALRSTPRDA